MGGRGGRGGVGGGAQGSGGRGAWAVGWGAEGRAEICSTTCIAHQDGDQTVFIKNASAIYCHFVDSGPSQLDHLFYNFSMAFQGSIRRAPHVLSWVTSLSKLKEDPTDAIRKWSANVSKNQALTGGKSMAVKAVLERMPPTVLAFLLEHVGQCGDYEASALSDDVLGSKRIYPGFVFRCVNGREWTNRGRVTTESLEVTAKWVVGNFLRTPKHIRTRQTKAAWEEASLELMGSPFHKRDEGGGSSGGS